VHHEIALADIGQEYEVDPINDLKPVMQLFTEYTHQLRLMI
jgi:hypothetical protein